MAGHSKFANIKHRKGAQDAKRAKMFTRIAKEIIVATQLGGADADSNPRLRGAIASARSANMPKDKIEYSIKRGSGELGGDNYEELRYEGYGKGGVAIIVETLSDNKNRTAAGVRTAFSKNGGNLGETGSVSFSFEKIGLIVYPAEIGDEETVLEAAIEAGADNCELIADPENDEDEPVYHISCALEELGNLRDELAKSFGDPQEAKPSWMPQNFIEIDENTAATNLRLIEALEENDDVQEVFSNMTISS